MALRDAFAGERPAFMPYLMGGFPSLDGTREVAAAYIEGGADVIEFGVPFSDPLADGPVIHAAATEALRNGATFDRVLEVAREVAQRVPLVLMCYANPLLRRGGEALADVGLAGLIVPDMPLEESAGLLEACDAAGIDLVPLVAPTTTDERLEAIGARARGFVYLVSTTGTTGEREDLDVSELLARVRPHFEVPVAVGFGISSPEQAARVAQAGADGVIVGSRLVRAAADGEDVGRLVARFRAALG